jgi:glyoxylase-like metal-dependent hydrolase (beta-lactamase superfamily II)
MPSPLTIRTFRHGPFWNFTYLLAVPGGNAIAIDPGGPIDELLAAAAFIDARITAAVLTHGHHDHFHGLAALLRASGATTFAHRSDSAAVLRESGIEPTPIGHEHQLTLGLHTLTLLHTPGHTEGSICILADGRLFTGDTLMTSGPGRHSFRPGAAETLARSLADILAPLPGETLVYPGHDEGPTPTASLTEALARDARTSFKSH